MNRALSRQVKRVRSVIFTLLSGVSLFILISCILGGDKVAGKRGSEVENELGVYGVLVDEGGKPVAGASVKAKPAASGIGKLSAAWAAALDSDSAATDADGRYAFPKLGAGKYDFHGEFKAKSLLVLIPEVIVKRAGLRQDLGVDTLRVPGIIQGRILEGDQGKGGVLCFVPGTSFLAVSDDSGRFAISNVPQGRYQVGYSLSGYLIPKDTAVLVRSGIVTMLPAKRIETDPALPPPAPRGLKAVVDTSDGHVTLTWSPVHVSDLSHYNIYRDENGVQTRVGFARDTIGFDYPAVAAGDAVRLTYRIRAQDSGLNESPVYSNPAVIDVYRGDWIYPALKWDSPSGQILPQTDSMALVIRYHLPGKSSVSIRWHLNGEVRPVRFSRTSGVDGKDTLSWPTALGLHRFEVRVGENSGMEPLYAHNTFRILPKGSRPVDAGPDTTVEWGGLARLQGRIDPAFGAIIGGGWENYHGPVPPLPGEPLGAEFRVPGGRDSLVCVLTVSDSNGLSAADSLIVRIARPKALEWELFQPRPGFRGRQETGFLSFRDRLWIIGGNHQFMRLGEEHGVQLSDVWSSSDGKEWIRNSDSAAFGERAGSVSAVFADRMWVLGGSSRDGKIVRNDVWNSADGREWNQASPIMPFTLNGGSVAFAFRDRLWVLNRRYSQNVEIPVGGLTGDAYSTADGQSWNMESGRMPFPPARKAIAHGDGIRALDDTGGVWGSQDGRAWTRIELPGKGFTPSVTDMVSVQGDLYFLGNLGPGGSCLWRQRGSAEVEAIQDEMPFSLYHAHMEALRERLFILEHVSLQGDYVNNVWTLP